MALLPTLVNDVINLHPDIDSNESRIMTTGLYDTFLRQSRTPGSVLTPELEQQLFDSMGKTVKTPVLKAKSVSVRTTRPLTIPLVQNTSAYATYTWSTISAGFLMYPTRHYNNYISYVREFARNFLDVRRIVMAYVENLALTKAEAIKTQVINGDPDIPGGHTFSGNVVHETGISALENSRILYDLESIHEVNDFGMFDGYDIVGNQHFRSVLSRLRGFDQFNSENKTLQFENKNFHFSRLITNDTGKAATLFAFAPNSVAVASRVETDCLLGSETHNREWGTIQMPGLDLRVGTYHYKDATDVYNDLATADTAHLTRSLVEGFDFSFDICFINKYNSDMATIPMPVVKADIALA